MAGTGTQRRPLAIALSHTYRGLVKSILPLPIFRGSRALVQDLPRLNSGIHQLLMTYQQQPNLIRHLLRTFHHGHMTTLRQLNYITVRAIE